MKICFNLSHRQGHINLYFVSNMEYFNTFSKEFKLGVTMTYLTFEAKSTLTMKNYLLHKKLNCTYLLIVGSSFGFSLLILKTDSTVLELLIFFILD